MAARGTREMISILDDSLDVVIRKVNRKVVDEELHLQKMTTPPRRSRRLAQLQPDEIQGDVVDTKNAAGKSAAHSSVARDVAC